jgi:hypothetical protein
MVDCSGLDDGDCGVVTWDEGTGVVVGWKDDCSGLDDGDCWIVSWDETIGEVVGWKDDCSGLDDGDCCIVGMKDEMKGVVVAWTEDCSVGDEVGDEAGGCWLELCDEVVFEDVVSKVDSGLVEGGGGSCNVFASVTCTSVVFTSNVFTSVVFTSVVFPSVVFACDKLDWELIAWLDELKVDRSEVIITGGVGPDFETVVGRFVSSEVGMLDIGTVLAIDTGEAVYCDILDEELELDIADELEVTKEDSIPDDRSDEGLGRKLVCPVDSIWLMSWVDNNDDSDPADVTSAVVLTCSDGDTTIDDTIDVAGEGAEGCKAVGDSRPDVSSLAPVGLDDWSDVDILEESTSEEGPAMTLDYNEVTSSLIEVACELSDPVLLSSIVIVGSPFSPMSSSSSLPLVSSTSPSSAASSTLVSSVPLAAFENPIDELSDEEVTREVGATDEMAAVNDVSELVMGGMVEVGDARVSRSIVDAPVPLATFPVLGTTEDQTEP